MLFANASPPRTQHARQGHAVARRGHPGHRCHYTLAGPRARAAAPLPEIVETDELSDPAFADWLRRPPPPPRWSLLTFLSRVRRECAVQLRKGAELPRRMGTGSSIRFLRQHKSEKKGVKAVKGIAVARGRKNRSY